MKALAKSYTMPGVGAPVVVEQREAADVTTWLSAHVEKSFVGVKKAYQFTLELKEVGGERKVLLSCKPFAASEKEYTVGVLLKVPSPSQVPRHCSQSLEHPPPYLSQLLPLVACAEPARGPAADCDPEAARLPASREAMQRRPGRRGVQ